MASRKVPALRTFSHVRVVRLARFRLSASCVFFFNEDKTHWDPKLTAEGSDGSVDWLHENALSVQLHASVSGNPTGNTATAAN